MRFSSLYGSQIVVCSFDYSKIIERERKMYGLRYEVKTTKHQFHFLRLRDNPVPLTSLVLASPMERISDWNDREEPPLAAKRLDCIFDSAFSMLSLSAVCSTEQKSGEQEALLPSTLRKSWR